jgi:hypothetical protein
MVSFHASYFESPVFKSQYGGWPASLPDVFVDFAFPEMIDEISRKIIVLSRLRIFENRMPNRIFGPKTHQ